MSVRLDHGGDTLDEVHEINVTPFIDVMLVLLIIFMVAAPLATVDIAVNLPASTAEPQPERPLYLTVKSDLISARVLLLAYTSRCTSHNARSERMANT
jgi:biopolymer transport protein ExbD